MSMKQLFQDYNLTGVLKQRRAEALANIEKLDPEQLVVSGEDLIEHLVERHRINAPRLIDGTQRITTSETQVPSGFFAEPSDQGFDISLYQNLEWVAGIRVSMDIDFAGDKFFFQTCPSSFTSHFPVAKVERDFITLEVKTADLNSSAIRGELDAQLAHVKEFLTSVRNEIEQFNSQLEIEIGSAITKRRQRLTAHAGIAMQIGYPLKERDDASKTFAVPPVRHKLASILSPTSRKASVPEPVLLDEHYELILGTIYHMAQVLERSPSAFSSMNEEALRTIFLVALNGIYEGKATAETFNHSGKTDILIREADRNIFVAECKFWKGSQSLEQAIDQILRYSVWRDSKLAIILFNRTRQISSVLEQIPGVLSKHTHFMRSLLARREGEFRAVLRHPDDAARELFLTVLMFDVPSQSLGENSSDSP